jgi:hypothetical protein
MYGLLLAVWLSGPPIFVPEDKIEEVARQYLRAPDMDDINRLPEAVQNRIYELEISRHMEIAQIEYRLQMELRLEDICLAAKGPEFPWKECLMEARRELEDYQCRLHELRHDRLEGAILEKMYRIDSQLKEGK